MISPKEIQSICLKWWPEVLLSFTDGRDIFPKEINRIGRVTTKDILNKLEEYQQSIELLKNHSKAGKRGGYTLITEERQFDKIGRQTVPVKIIIESLEDYLSITKKEREYRLFCQNFDLILSTIPSLKEWIKENPLKLIEHDSWKDTLKVCTYFLSTPKPCLYIRQLPIDVHTKCIQDNQHLLQSLLEYLIPEAVNFEEKKFEQRFNLKYAEPLIRIRFLDDALSPLRSVTDISLPVSEMKKLPIPCDHIFVAENLMNFLTLPNLEKTIALWSGGGFSVSYLNGIGWMREKQFFYWGDVDAQGFQILNQFRTYFPNTISVMMDEETLQRFSSKEGKPAPEQQLHQLTKTEHQLYEYVRANNLRLEQEKITLEYALGKIKQSVESRS